MAADPGSSGRGAVGAVLDRLLRQLVGAFTLIGALGLVAMTVHVNVDVLGKYLFSAPAPATIEMVSYYYMAAVAMLPLAALERRGSLVHVDLLYQSLPVRVRLILHPAALGVASAYCFAAGYAAWEPAVRAWSVGAYAGTSVTVMTWPTRFIPVAGFGLLAVVLALKAAVLLRERRSGSAPADPAI